MGELNVGSEKEAEKQLLLVRDLRLSHSCFCIYKPSGVLHRSRLVNCKFLANDRANMPEYLILQLYFFQLTGEWRKLHNEELKGLYSSPNIVRVIKSRRMRWAGHVARMGEGREVYRVLVGKPEGKRPLGRPRRKWEDNIRMDLQEVGLGYEDWNGLAQDRDRWRALVSAVRNLRVP